MKDQYGREYPGDITSRQRQVLAWVQIYRDWFGVMPTRLQIATACGIEVNAANQLLWRLQKKGWLRLGYRQARAIEITRRLDIMPMVGSDGVKTGEYISLSGDGRAWQLGKKRPIGVYDDNENTDSGDSGDSGD